jgi:uracil-DNA glycosylase
MTNVHMSDPKGFRSPAAVAARLGMLARPEAQLLKTFADEIAARRDAVVPHFDPAEGGIDVRVLLVQEAPGPMTNASNLRPGSGFISVDNDDATAQQVWTTRNEFGLHSRMLSWNIVPWYLGPASVKPKAPEIAAGAMELRRLLSLLSNVEVVLTSGLIAQRGWNKHVSLFADKSLTVIPTWHASPLSMKQPGKRDELRRAFERAAQIIG